MSVYRKFTRNDILFSTIHAKPKVAVKYGLGGGQTGWFGNSGVSGSLSLYGGVRARYNVKASDFQTSGLSIYPLDLLDTHSIDKVIFVSGSYPSTGSIRFVRCTNTVAPNFFTSITDIRWYEEHYRPIELLYDHYSTRDDNYFTGSYDFYDSLLLADTALTSSVTGSHFYPGPYWAFSGAFASTPITGPTSSFTAEAWIKPIPTDFTASLPFPNYPSIMGQRDTWNFSINPDGTLQLNVEHAASASYPQGSDNAVVAGEWNRVALVVQAGQTASFWINGVFGGERILGNDTFGTGSTTHPLLVGGFETGTGYVLGVSGAQNGNNLNGFVFETRVWNRALSGSELQTNASGTLVNSSSTGLVHYARFNDGPFGTAHGFASGSGAFDYSPNANHGYHILWSGAHINHWQPNDHPTFIPVTQKVNLDIQDLRLFHVPSMFYGKQIDPGSVRITDGVYNKRRVVRVFNDDGRGGLYVSGSMTRDISGEEYTGEKRRKVGNVFYSEGLIVFTDPALYDMFDSGSLFWDSQISVSGVFGDLISADFKGQATMRTKTFNCRLATAQGNASNNPTFSYVDDRGTVNTDDDRVTVERHDGVTYITSIGLYNEDRQLVAVAKLAQPIRKREKDKINLRLKMDF